MLSNVASCRLREAASVAEISSKRKSNVVFINATSFVGVCLFLLKRLRRFLSGLGSKNFQAKVIPGEVSTFPTHTKQFKNVPSLVSEVRVSGGE